MKPDDRTSPELADGEARVLFLWEGGTERRALPDGVIITVGRSSECDVRIDHPSVSRMHARVIAGTPVRVEDLGSSNGVRVRGSLVTPRQPVVVNSGDVVELGSVVLVVQGATPNARPAPPTPWEVREGSGHDVVSPLRRLLGLVANSDLSIVITGETGVGKNVAARWIHDHSPRAAMPFVLLNCAALPDALLEGELFGYEKGAFTGATQAKQGLIESANRGTLLLDEIGELPLVTQAKLLGVLENREVLRLGSLKPRPVDLRLLAATNRDLDALVREGKFRADLHFRLNGMTVAIPPLRERAEEIPELARLFLERACARTGRRVPAFSAAAIATLVRQPWPGNVRELRNTMDRAAALCTTDELLPEHLAMPNVSTATERPPPLVAPSGDTLWGETEALERRRVLEALERSGGNQTQAAKLLGISRRALINRLELYDVPRPRKGKD
ncbi:MAG: Response regulator of zinc sigma-54-dependent two-component system [Labilithrix sp.]|nr:Response regulator of zinc sigma-54-dependent two-component system [Labilithrix sp.]